MTGSGEWRGRVGDVWAREWRRTDRSFTHLSARLDAVVAAAAPDGVFAALDIGCGAGGTALALLAARADARIVGIDLSEGLLAVARDRAGAAGVGHRTRFIHGDAALLAVEHGPFDLLVSRHGVMFFPDPRAAFAALHAAARPGAALVFSCFRDWRENDFYHLLAEAIDVPPPDPVAPGPFAFADRTRVAAILAAAGWRDASAQLVDFAYRAGEGDAAVDDATAFLTRIGPAAARMRDLPDGDHAALRARVRAVIAGQAHGDAVDFPAAAWIWTARA